MLIYIENKGRFFIRKVAAIPARAALLIISLMVMAFAATAELSGPVPVGLLVSQADTVVVGTIVQGSLSPTGAAFTIQIERVINGSSRPGEVIGIVWQPAKPLAVPTSKPLPTIDLKGIRGLFFGLKASVGQMTVVSATVNALDARSTFFRLPPQGNAPPLTYKEGDSVLDKVVRELLPTDGFRRSTPGITAVLDCVETAVHRPATSTVIQEVGQNLVLSSSVADRVTATQVLLASGDLGALTSIEGPQKELLSDSTGAGMADIIRQYYRNAEPNSIATLGRMSQGATTELRYAAAGALAMMHTRATLPYLAQLLDSQDVSLLQYAVGGLAMFANNVPMDRHEPAPGPAPFRTDDTIAHSAMGTRIIAAKQAYYVNFWKSWWINSRGALGL